MLGRCNGAACGACRFSDAASVLRPWDASRKPTAPVLALAIAGERDFWSRPEAMRNLAADLVHAAGECRRA